MALEDEAETDFTSLLAGLDISNGVATISQFSMTNPVLSLSGDGSINLGAQKIDDVGISFWHISPRLCGVSKGPER